MDENFNGHQTIIPTFKNEIRINQFNLFAKLQVFKKELPDISFEETSQICERVKDQILYFQDETYLSATQNNYRRFFIASELFFEICDIYELIVDHKFNDIINDMIQWEKFQKISRKISCKNKIQIKREKPFALEAQTKILKDDSERKRDENSDLIDLNGVVESRVEEEVQEQLMNVLPLERQVISPKQSEILQPNLEEYLDQAPAVVAGEPRPIETSDGVTEGALEKIGRQTEVESLTQSPEKIPELTDVQLDKEQLEIVAAFGQKSAREDSNIVDFEENMKNITQIREELMTEAHSLIEHSLDVPRGNLTLPNIAAETSIKASNIVERNHENDEDIEKILQILEDRIPGEKILEIQPPEPQIEVRDNVRVEEERHDDATHPDVTEILEELNLPDLEPRVETDKKERQLIIDDETYIRGYAARALQVNKNIKIQRVQVYEGPPRILKAISVGALMTTPSFRNSLLQSVRSCKLNSLYRRHLKVEKKTLEETYRRKGISEKPRELNVSKAQTVDVVEDLERKAPFSAIFEKSVLADIATDQNLLADLDITVGAQNKDNLIGRPLSRLYHPVIEPPSEMQMERINSTLPPPSPRVQQLQGKSIEPNTTPIWIAPTKKDPPHSRFTDLNKVYKTLEYYWSLNENQGMHKCITLREFFSYENEVSLTNYLTVLRVLDKLSIKRKVLLEYKNPDVFIFPFEKPYVTDGQLVEAERELIF